MKDEEQKNLQNEDKEHVGGDAKGHPEGNAKGDANGHLKSEAKDDAEGHPKDDADGQSKDDAEGHPKENVDGKEKQKKKSKNDDDSDTTKEVKAIDIAAEEKQKRSEEKSATGDDEHHEEYEFHEDEDEDEDFEKLNTEELIEKIQHVTGREISHIKESTVEAIKDAFFHIIDHDRELALEEFLKEEGNVEDDFEYTKDKALIQKFNTYYHGYKEKKKKFHGDLSKLKEENLKKKDDILERLRQFVDEEEDNVSVKTLKDLEEEWKAAEPIPANFNRELWANFNALRDRFYDKRSIFFELKDLDRKKNQKLKEEVIEKAKELLNMDPVNAAVAELKKLHEEYKHIGSVPNEIRPVLWEEFKKISDQIHERKQEVSAEFKKKLDENLEAKKELIKKLNEYYEFSSDKISEWNEKSKEIMNVQETWKAIGPVPRELSKEISKTFWSHFKTFFKNKQQFFKSLDEKREKNYDAKEKLCEEIEKILEEGSDDKQVVDKVKQMQRDWKNIGPAPRKKSEVIYKRFKSACDQFFDNLRGHRKEQEKDFEVNLEKKNEIARKIESIKEFSEDTVDEVKKLIEDWVEIGFVPKKAIKSSKSSIQNSLEKFLSKAKDVAEDEKDILETQLKGLLMKADFHGSRNIRGEMDKIRRQISKLNDETTTLKTNMEFFASTKNAEKLKDEVQQKIDKAEVQIDKLKNKIKLLRQIDN